MSNKFKDFFTAQGIMHQISYPHTPEQNGISKRKNRHIRETAVTMIQTASVPSHFWYHVCALATYLINRMPTPVLDMFSPFVFVYLLLIELINYNLRLLDAFFWVLLLDIKVLSVIIRVQRDIMFHDMCYLMKTIFNVPLLPLFQGLLTLISNLQYSLISLSLSPLFL